MILGDWRFGQIGPAMVIRVGGDLVTSNVPRAYPVLQSVWKLSELS